MNEVELNKQANLSPHLASPSEAALSQTNELDGLRLSPHFTLAELTKTSYHTLDGNIPSRVAIENLKRVCGWLEILRERYNMRYGDGFSPPELGGVRGGLRSGGEVPIVISSGYRSEAVNMKWDIRCYGPEQMIRMAGILLDIADENGWVFDELIQEQRGTTYWVHFAVRPKNNRRKILFDCR